MNGWALGFFFQIICEYYEKDLVFIKWIQE